MTLSDDSPVNNVRDVRRRFDRAAPHFDTADFVHSVTRNGLLERLDPILIDAKTVVDLGSATGSGSRLLAKRFRRALVISTDLSLCMLEQGKAKKSWFDRTSAVQANATAQQPRRMAADSFDIGHNARQAAVRPQRGSHNGYRPC